MNPVVILFVIVSVLFIAIVGLTVLLFQLKQEIIVLKKYNSKIFSRLTGVMKDLQNMTNATYGIGQQVNHINDQVKNLDARQDELDLREQSDKPIEQAIALLEKGADIEEVMQTCYLTRGEAELLFRIHGQYE